MIVKVINNHVLKIYDSIENMPIVNFQKYNKFMLIDSIIGSDVADVAHSIQKAIAYIHTNNPGNAVKQLENLQNGIYLIGQEISPKYLAFTALIAEIDNKKVSDLSDSNLQHIFGLLNKAPKNKIDSVLSLFKKKVDTELETYFPGNMQSNKVKEAYSKLKRKVLLELDALIDNIDNYTEIQKLDNDLLTINKPLIFKGNDSFEVKTDKQFNELGIYLAKTLNVDVKTLTVFQFYNSLEYADKEAKRNKKVK